MTAAHLVLVPAETTRTCTGCGVEKPLDRQHFHVTKGRFRARCAQCCLDRDRARQGYARKERDPRLPLGPFREWIVGRLERGESIDQLSVSAGISVRRLADMRDGRQARVKLSVVDRALLDSPTGLWELYPALCSVEEQVAA